MMMALRTVAVLMLLGLWDVGQTRPVEDKAQSPWIVHDAHAFPTAAVEHEAQPQPYPDMTYAESSEGDHRAQFFPYVPGDGPVDVEHNVQVLQDAVDSLANVDRDTGYEARRVHPGLPYPLVDHVPYRHGGLLPGVHRSGPLGVEHRAHDGRGGLHDSDLIAGNPTTLVIRVTRQPPIRPILPTRRVHTGVGGTITNHKPVRRPSTGVHFGIPVWIRNPKPAYHRSFGTFRSLHQYIPGPDSEGRRG